MDNGACWATVHGVTKNQPQLRDWAWARTHTRTPKSLLLSSICRMGSKVCSSTGLPVISGHSHELLFPPPCPLRSEGWCQLHICSLQVSCSALFTYTPTSPPLHPWELGTATVIPLPREGNRSAKKPSVWPRSHSQEVREPGLKTQSLAPAASHTCWGPASAAIMSCSMPASRRYLSQWTHRFRAWALYFSKVLRSSKFIRGLIKGK